VKKFLFVFLILGASAGCMKINQFERNVQIPSQEWHYAFQPEIRFDITDTTSLYNVYLTLRHTDKYAYSNIWLEIATQQPGDTTFQQERFEFGLQEAGGKWLGTGYADIWELRHLLFPSIKLRKTGTYTIRIRQIMRDEPLRHVMNVGIRVEKLK
jgi:gliding motility-associated lipoprotein GldH